MSSNLPRQPRVIARQLSLGFGAVSLVSVVMCIFLLVTLREVSGLVSGMEHQESSVAHSLELATAVREQSLHIAHTVIEGDTSHLARYEVWRERTRSRIQLLANRVPASENARLQLLGEKTQRLHDLFISSVLPTLKQGSTSQARELHRELAQLGEQAAQNADALARAVATRMTQSHRAATNATELGLLGGGLCVAIVIALAAGFTIRLRAAVLKPLFELTESARRFGCGEFELRVGDLGAGEMGDLGRAFDRMADEIGERERRLVRQERMAAIGQLAAGVAHELNNPIGIIRGYLKTMSPHDEPDSLAEELRILDEEAAHCQRIAEDLLSYARSSDLETEDIEMQSFLTESAARFIENTEGERPQVSVNAQDVVLHGDRARIRQVFFNVLRNAVQVTAAQESIDVVGAVHSDFYRIDVRDGGPGVPNEDREQIFEPFFTKRRGGTGLGLSVAVGIVRAHGGSIQVVDSPSGGGVFRIELPLSGPRSAGKWAALEGAQ